VVNGDPSDSRKKIIVMNLSPQVKAMIASYARSFGGAVLALYMTGNTNPSDLVAAGVAAVAPMMLRYLNPKDTAFGRTSK
jgi:hypothetical protein